MAYGLEAKGAAKRLGITEKEAQELINEYFRTFPAIGGLLTRLGNFGVRRGYICTPPPFLRRRYFDYWEEKRGNGYWMGKVERASKNMPKCMGM